MKKNALWLLIALSSLNCYAQTSTLCLEEQEAKAVNLFAADCFAKERIIDSLEAQVGYYADVVNDCRATFSAYDSKLSVKDSMIANAEARFEAREAQTKLLAQQVKEVRKKHVKMIAGFTVGGFVVGVAVPVIIFLLK